MMMILVPMGGLHLQRLSDEVDMREQECVNAYGADFLKKLISRLT